jgi:hypothetical protein
MATLVMVSGSLRSASTNGAVVRAAAGFARAHPAVDDVHITPIRSLPLFDEDVEAAGDPAEVTRFKDLIACADAVVISTPEYNASVPRRAQERDRLGLAPVRRERAAREAGRRPERVTLQPRRASA